MLVGTKKYIKKFKYMIRYTSVCDIYKMNKIRELKIDSTLWATPSKIINLIDFKPEILSIETKCNANNNIKVHHVKYENGGFYLTIDNLRGYFNFSNNRGTLTRYLLMMTNKISIIKYGKKF